MNPWDYLSGMGGFQQAQGFDPAQIVPNLGPDPTSRMLQMDINRGVLPGSKTPGFEQYDPSQLAQLDRYAWGQQGGLGGLPVAMGYEGLKAASQTPGLSRVLPFASRMLGFENTGNQFEQDETSSPASFANIGQYLRGALTNPVPGMGGFFGR